jgi:hypothetical protein
MAKRSEAIKQIENILDDNYHSAFKDAWLYTKEVAEDILKTIEEIGMIPPTTYLDKLKVYDNGWEQE